MKKRVFVVLIALLSTSVLFASCSVFHEHSYGAYQFDGVGHFKECSCGYKIAESYSNHTDKNYDDACDICGYSMKYEIDSLEDLSYYLLYYYELSQYEYLNESNMKPHSIHDMNFKNTVTYNEYKTKFESPWYEGYMTKLPSYEEYIKSNTEYYSRYITSFYMQTNIPVDYYSYITQETIRYALSEQSCDYQRFYETVSKFREVDDFFETASSSALTKTVYTDAEHYDDSTLSYKHETINAVANDLSQLIKYRLNVEFTDGEIILPEASYFNGIDVRTENGIAYFSIEKNDGKTFWGEDIRYSIEGSINLKTQALKYNEKESYYVDGELVYYIDYDYNLTLTNELIDIEFDTDGEFVELYVENS